MLTDELLAMLGGKRGRMGGIGGSLAFLPGIGPGGSLSRALSGLIGQPSQGGSTGSFTGTRPGFTALNPTKPNPLSPFTSKGSIGNSGSYSLGTQFGSIPT